MLFGTPLYFRICYFFTAFSPALFLISLNYKLDFKIDIKSAWFEAVLNFLLHYLLSIAAILSAVIATLLIKRFLKKRRNGNYSVEHLALNFNHSEKRIKNANTKVIQVQNSPKINSGFIAFALSVVSPPVVATFVKDNQGIFALILVILFFLLLMLSNDVFPNIFLPLFRVQLLSIDGYNIFYFSKDSEFLTGVKRINSLGDSGSLARTYVLTDNEFLESEIEDI
ncbi:hypothetical protein [Lactococcus formosensis]|uniref:hypothetical protein n=1 Tax=Lactococcus formosensis TaxID=1281486 RepID=UPI00324F947B